MKLKFNKLKLALILLAIMACKNKETKPVSDVNIQVAEYYTEPYRPQFHFTPQENWMNDPNGLVYHDGIYHLFYQYYPEDIVWGPMHWGHAVSEDLIHWQHRPIALFPDKLGYIFSGSAVLDSQNTSGLGSAEHPPLVAIFTYHDMEGEKAGRNDYQTQGIAFSLDNGETWTKYERNPVIGNEGIKDFRDPKVFWNTETALWNMLLVAGDHLQIYSSPNLKEWKKISEFGKDQGAHGGVWECPDLFKLKVEGSNEEKWVLLISINPGAPNGGSGTQYFVGDFDGTTFTSDQQNNRWIDWGTDNYAGVTYNNVPNGEHIFIGWMSNWAYARDTPTDSWRSANTVPRKLSLRKIDGSYELINYPIKNLDSIIETSATKNLLIGGKGKEGISFDNFNQSEIKFMTLAKDFSMTFKNSKNEQLVVRMDGNKGFFSLDRSKSGKTDFQEDFGTHNQEMPITNLPDGAYEVRILMDHSSIEVFINKGQYVMTAQLFPNENYNALTINNFANTPLELTEFTLSKVKRIW